MSFFKELRRRNVFRVAAGYVVVAWLILQVVSALGTPLALPNWFETVVVLLLAIGFPLAMVFAWAFELTPEGIILTDNDAGVDSTSGNRLDYALIGGLLFVAAVTLWGRFPSSTVNDSVTGPVAAQDQSIAVLPFADMSPDGDQEYFGDGVAEELLNELTRLEGLRVAGRTSSFSFKERAEDLRTIGETLGVSTILEGSVRKDGDRIRISAQLVNAADGYQLWSETFEREVTDIFAIQEEIATSVAGALGVRLGVGGVNAYQGAGTRSVEAYEAYLEGLSIGGNEGRAIPFFERALDLDPEYAAAWAELGVRTAATQWTSNPKDAPAIKERAYGFVRRAVELDPESAQAISLLGTLVYARKDWIGGEELHVRALSVLADRPALVQHGNLLMRTGRLTAALMRYDAAQAAEPLGGQPPLHRWHINLAQGRFAEARESAAWFPQERSAISIALNVGDPEEIEAAISAMPPSDISKAVLYDPVLSVFDSREMVLSTLRAVHANEDSSWPSKLHDIALLAAYFDDPQFALQVISEELLNTTVRLQAVWYPLMSEVRQLPGFKELMMDLNLDAYWRANGWADFCRPAGADDFSCN